MIRSLLLFFLSFSLVACRVAPVEATPKDEAAAVLDRHVEVTGGAQAYSHPFRVSKGTVLYKSLGILCQLTVHESRSTDRRWHSRSEATGDRFQASFADAAWSCGLMSGVFVKEGEALEEELRAAPLDAPLEWRRHFDHARRLPDRSHEGRAMHVVELVSASGGNETRFYDAETGFHVRTETRREYYGNLVPTVVSYGDYRPVDDAVLPHSIRVDYAGFEEHIMEIQEVVHAESLPRQTFEPPAEVRAVMGS